MDSSILLPSTTPPNGMRTSPFPSGVVGDSYSDSQIEDTSPISRHPRTLKPP